MPRKGIPIETIIEVVRAKLGFISQVAKALNVSQVAIYDRIKRNKKLQDAVREINEEKLDFTESKLMEQIREGNLGAICFHLKCKGKHRGYVERQEITGTEGGPMAFKFYDFDPSKFPPEKKE